MSDTSKIEATYPMGSGWRCSFCQMWVPQGVVHLCQQQPPTATPFPQVTVNDATQLRIAAALERIAAALELDRPIPAGDQEASPSRIPRADSESAPAGPGSAADHPTGGGAE